MIVSLRARAAHWPAAAVWSALGLATLALYTFPLTARFSLVALIGRPGLTLAKLAGYAPLTGLLYALAFSALFGLYWLAFRHAQSRHGRGDWLQVALWLAAFSFVLLWLYPIDAADVFEYIMRGRMSVWYGANPFVDVPSEFPRDPVYRYIAWRYVPSAYGPLWELLAGALVRLAGRDLLLTVFAYKLAALAGYAAALVLIAATLRRLAPERALAGVVLFGWCPLVIYTTAGGGHNDSLMIAGLMLGAFLLVRGRPAAAIWAAVAGALVKLIPLFYAPLFFVHGWARLSAGGANGTNSRFAPTGPRRRFALAALGGSLLLVAALFAPYFRPAQDADILDLQRRSQLFTSSTPAFAHAVLMRVTGLDKAAAANIVTPIAYGILGVAGLWALWAAARPDPLAPLRAGRDLLLVYLLAACLWLMPWYAGWLLAASALLPEDRVTRAGALLAWLMMLKVVFFEYVLMPYGKGPPAAVRELWLGPLLLGPVWLYLLAGGVRAWRARRRAPAAA